MWVAYFCLLYIMLDLKKFLVILIISSAVTFAEESKRYQVSSFIFYCFLCEELTSDLELHVHSSQLGVKSRGLPLIFSCSRSCLSGAMATLDRRCSRKFSTHWRRTSPFARGETPEWSHPTSLQFNESGCELLVHLHSSELGFG